MNAKSVSVVIPNYNGRGLLESNLPSVFAALERSSLSYEVIIPDDASTDDSVVFLKRQYPLIQVIEAEKNLGFAGNINRGLRAASKDLVLALNSDIFLEKDYFEKQLSYFDNPQVFGVMGAIYDPQTKKNVPLDLFPKQSFWGFLKAVAIPDYHFDHVTPIYFLSGSNALMNRQKLLELNYFNEAYSPFYGEDADLGLRSWRKGWISLYEPQSVCFHQSSSTISRYNKRRRIRLISRRNKLLFHQVHLDGWVFVKFKCKTMLDLLTRWLVLDFDYYAAYSQYLALQSPMKSFMERQVYSYSTSQALHFMREQIKKGISWER